tara:strand:+ start:165 stop:539 length:375 start_codon:yes stop_codon:yes gene_type:complete
MDIKSKDSMELRSQKERDSYQFEKLRKIIDLAKSNSEGWKSILEGIKSDSIKKRNDLNNIPITQKSSLSKFQSLNPPLGGLTTKNPNNFRHYLHLQDQFMNLEAKGIFGECLGQCKQLILKKVM